MFVNSGEELGDNEIFLRIHSEGDDVNRDEIGSHRVEAESHLGFVVVDSL